MFEPAERLKNVKVSASSAMTRKVRELRAQGVKIVGLSSGEPDFMSPRHAIEAGYKAALAGDTVPCAGVDAMCAGADAYVQTVIRADLVNMVANMVPTGGRFKDILDYHSTVEQAAQTAARNGVKNLMLTHYVPPLQAAQEDEWRALAAQHFDGNIVLGPDLTSLDI